MLTNKQERFVQELVKGKSQREAYKASYNAERMKDATIDKRASDLFLKGDIRGRYNEIMAEIQANVVDEVTEAKKLIIDTEMAIVSAHLGQIYRVEGIEDEDGWATVVKPRSQEEIDKFDMRAVQEIRFDSKGRPIFKLYDKQPAVNTLREILGIGNEVADTDINIVIKASEEYDK